jgi:hypothetical protein
LRQGLVHCTVSSLSLPPAPLLSSSFFGRETDETFINCVKDEFVSACAINKMEEEVVLHTQEVQPLADVVDC